MESDHLILSSRNPAIRQVEILPHLLVDLEAHSDVAILHYVHPLADIVSQIDQSEAKLLLCCKALDCLAHIIRISGLKALILINSHNIRFDYYSNSTNRVAQHSIIGLTLQVLGIIKNIQEKTDLQAIAVFIQKFYRKSIFQPLNAMALVTKRHFLRLFAKFVQYFISISYCDIVSQVIVFFNDYDIETSVLAHTISKSIIKTILPLPDAISTFKETMYALNKELNSCTHPHSYGLLIDTINVLIVDDTLLGYFCQHPISFERLFSSLKLFGVDQCEIVNRFHQMAKILMEKKHKTIIENGITALIRAGFQHTSDLCRMNSSPSHENGEVKTRCNKLNIDPLTFSHKFDVKRNYTAYHKDQLLRSQIFEVFASRHPESYTLVEIQEKTNIPANILTKWRKRFMADKSYRPGCRFGHHKRRFTESEERAVADLIRMQYVIPGILVRRKQLKNMLFQIWRQFDLSNRSKVVRNFFSYHFVSNLCSRNNLSFRKLRKKRRGELKMEEVKEFSEEYVKLFTKYPPQRILNMDETPWNFVFHRGCVLAEIGADEVAGLPGDIRDKFTVISTISADGGKFPPLFLAQGKTDVCHRQFNGMTSPEDSFRIFHSSGGNTDYFVMKYYLDLVHQSVGKNPCALILDRYASHTSDEIKACANDLGIHLVYIPTSGTEVYQPLDRKVFGVLKSMASSFFNDHVFANQTGFTKAQAADICVKCWNKLSPFLIKSVFDFGDFDEDEDDTLDSIDTLYCESDSADDDIEEEIDLVFDDKFIGIINRKKNCPRIRRK